MATIDFAVGIGGENGIEERGVTDGRLIRNARARVLRGRQPIYDGGFATLRHFQEDVKEIRSGQECGVKLGDYDEYEVGDIIECYTLEKVAQTL